MSLEEREGGRRVKLQLSKGGHVMKSIGAFIFTIVVTAAMISSCNEDTTNDPGGSTPDASLFAHVTQTDPFTSYTLFPNADSVTSGTLNGSTAHQPLIRVSMNDTAFSVLQAGVLPPGTRFPNGSVVFKEIITGGQTSLYAVMMKDTASEFAGNGWLWAEYYPDGRVAISVEGNGSACVACHSLEQGLQNDFVRTFERQN